MDGHLGCFQLSAIVNNAAKEHRCTNIFNSLEHIPKVALLDHMVSIFLIFEEPHTASIAAALFYIPTHSVEGLSSSL